MDVPGPPPPSPPLAEEADLWYVGAIINVIGSIAINLGTNLMKLGHNKRANFPDDQRPPVRKIREWVIGMSFFTVGNILNFVSFGFAAQSLLAALGSIQFVSNVIFASFVLKESINRMILLATTCIVGGCVLLVVFGNQSGATYTVKQLTQLYGEPAYIVYMCLMAVGVVGGYLVYLHGQRMVNKNGPRGFWYAILPIAYSIFSALIGTQSVLFSKSMSVILRLTFSGENQLGNWYTWLVLPLFFSTAIFWITRLNKGLRMFPAMIIVPVMQISWTLFSIISGMLYFQEYLGFTPLKSAMFPIGVLIVFVGVFLLTQSGASKQASYQKMEDEAAKQAAKQDDAKSAFGSGTSNGIELSRRQDSIDVPRSEISIPVEPSAAAVARLESPDEWDRERAAPAAAASPAPSTPPAAAAAAVRTIEDGPDSEASPSKLPALAEEELEGSKVAGSPSSMMDNVKRRLRAMQERLNKDLLSVEAREGFKQAMGLGEGGVSAISIFAMPTMMDYAREMNPSGRYSDVTAAGSREDADGSNGLKPILEDLDGPRSTGSFTLRPSNRTGGDFVQPSFDSSPSLPRPGTAPASPRQPTLGRKLMNKAERAAKVSLDAVKKAPGNLQRAVREKQGYGSLYDDEERGLLEVSHSLEAVEPQEGERR